MKKTDQEGAVGKRRTLRGRPVSRYADRSGNSTIGVGLEVLRIVGRARQSVTLSEIARKAGMSLGRTSRYISSLARSDFLCQDETTGRIDLGPAAFELGQFATARIDVPRLAHYLTRRLSNATNLASIICVWGDEGPLVTHFQPSPSDLSIAIRDGAKISLTAHAAGQIFLAFEQPEKTRSLLEEELKGGQRLSAKGRRDASAKIETLCAEIKQAGIAATGSVENPLAGAIAIPVFDGAGSLYLSMAVIGLTHALDEKNWEIATAQLRRLAMRFSARLKALGV